MHTFILYFIDSCFLVAGTGYNKLVIYGNVTTENWTGFLVLGNKNNNAIDFITRNFQVITTDKFIDIISIFMGKFLQMASQGNGAIKKFIMKPLIIPAVIIQACHHIHSGQQSGQWILHEAATTHIPQRTLVLSQVSCFPGTVWPAKPCKYLIGPARNHISLGFN